MGLQTSDTATLTFNFDGTSNAGRNWEIKVTQVPCYAKTA